MKIQLALDRLSENDAFEITAEVVDFIDWIEIGTGMIKEYGIRVVTEMKDRYPHKYVVADMKTCDAGKHETEQALNAGADITTVMAFASDRTLTDSIAVAHDLDKQVMIDLLGVKENKEIRRIVDLGATLVSLHFGKDMQKEGGSVSNSFDLLQGNQHLKVAVAGSINEETLPNIINHQPETVIIGSGITGAQKPRDTAAHFQRMVKHNGFL